MSFDIDNVLRQKYRELVQNIEVDKGLLDFLFARNVITSEQMNHISSFPLRENQVRELLTVVRRLDYQGFQIFLDGLRETEQWRVVIILSGNESERKHYIHVGGLGEVRIGGTYTCHQQKVSTITTNATLSRDLIESLVRGEDAAYVPSSTTFKTEMRGDIYTGHYCNVIAPSLKGNIHCGGSSSVRASGTGDITFVNSHVSSTPHHTPIRVEAEIIGRVLIDTNVINDKFDIHVVVKDDVEVYIDRVVALRGRRVHVEIETENDGVYWGEEKLHDSNDFVTITRTSNITKPFRPIDVGGSHMYNFDRCSIRTVLHSKDVNPKIKVVYHFHDKHVLIKTVDTIWIS